MTNAATGETQILLYDSYAVTLDPAIWNFNEFLLGGSFYGRTQMRQTLPAVSDGLLRLRLDSFNPTGFSFFGSEVISRQSFSTSLGGVAFEARVRLASPVPGVVGGFFAYHFNTITRLHDEIDYELLGNDAAAAANRVQTNAYRNEPLGVGHPQFVPLTGLTGFHTYRMEWFTDRVRWLIDGQLAREDTVNVPQGAMELHLNIWAPAADWAEAYSAAIQPTASPAANTAYFVDVDYARVARLSAAVGAGASEIAVRDTGTGLPLTATGQLYTGPVIGLASEYINITPQNLAIAAGSNNWFIHSGSGTDAIAALGGVNVLDGGTGSNFLVGGSGLGSSDTFFVDYRDATASTWSTVVGFGAGDAATVWGITEQDFDLSWVDSQGATGYTGLTVHATAPGHAGTASLTLAGYTRDDLDNGRLSASFGIESVSGSAYLYILGNG